MSPNRQTQSKDAYHPNTARGNEGNFRIAVRFFDENETELRPVSGDEAVDCEYLAPKCNLNLERRSHEIAAQSGVFGRNVES